jgi:predicted PurR-regulated permease PerM
MLFICKRNNKKVPDRADRLKGNLLQKLDEASLQLQYKCAQWLERKTAQLSRKSWIVILTSFILFTSSCCIYLLVASFSQTTTSSITITPITKPINALQMGKQMIDGYLSISKTEFEKMVRFRRYMDSLGRSPTGKKIQDSIMQFRPGLLDSLTIVENQYHLQFKN